MSISQQIQPGQCPIDPDTGLPECPPPTEIDVISVKRVFSESFETQEEEIEIPFEAPTLEVLTAGVGVLQEANQAECVSAEVNLINCFTIDENHVRIVYSLEVTARVPLDGGGFETSSETVIVTNILCLPCADREDLELECELNPRCIFSFVSERDDLGNVTQVTAFVEICIVVRMVAQVQLIVPSFGFCQPPPCSIISPSCPVPPPEQCNE